MTGVYPTLYYINGRPTTAEPVLFHLTDVDNDTLWALLYDWEVRLGDWTFIVPKGRASNMGSVPWFARWLISPNDPVIAIPSIAHDYLVNEWDVIITNPDDVSTVATNDLISWKEAATLFLLWNRNSPSKFRRVKSQIVYYCVMLYGFLLNRQLGHA